MFAVVVCPARKKACTPSKLPSKVKTHLVAILIATYLVLLSVNRNVIAPYMGSFQGTFVFMPFVISLCLQPQSMICRRDFVDYVTVHLRFPADLSEISILLATQIPTNQIYVSFQGEGFDVMKSGDARVALIGFPSVGKVRTLRFLLFEK